MRKYGLLVLAVALAGCLASDGDKWLGTNSIPATGTAIAVAKSHVQSAEKGVSIVKPFVAKAGQPVLQVISDEHAQAITAMDDGAAKLAAVQAERDGLVSTIHNRETTIGTLNAKVDKLTHSWGYQLQLWVLFFFWLIVTLAGVHLVAAAAAMFLPMPYNGVAATVANIVNPLGWINWLVTHTVKNAQANAAAGRMEMLPPAPSPPPNH